MSDLSSGLPDRTMVASVADRADTVVAAIYRHVEPMLPEAGLHAVIIGVDGDVDVEAAAHLEHVLRQAVDDGAPVCCDLGSAAYFGAAGANAVLAAFSYAADVGTLFLLRGVDGLTGHVLAAVGFDQRLIMR